MLADLEGRIVTQHEFLAFLATARGPGYRPATPAEAVRLVRAYLRTLLERGPPVSLTAASGPAPAAVAVADRTSRIRVSDSELRGFVGRHPHLRGEGGPEPYAALRDRLRRHRVERASRWMLDTLLDESAFTIEADAIEALVCAQPTAAPPLPPGFAPASGMPGAVSR